jgi:tetratricopeptide (TPR) repeat protein
VTGAGASPHLHPEHLAALGAAERDLLLHVANCGPCRRLTATVLGPSPAAPSSAAADAAIRRLLDRLEGTAGLSAKLAAVEHERREAHDLVEELRIAPESWAVAGADPRYASAEVVWQLLAHSEAESPPLALQLIDLAADIALRLAGVQPETSLYRQLIVEARCARADRLLDVLDLGGTLRELRRAETILTPDITYARALYCRSLARLRRHQQRWEEALSLAARAVALFADHATLVELGRAQIDQAWILLETGEPDEAVPLFELALPQVGGAPSCLAIGQLGLAVARLESGLTRDVKQLLAGADGAIAVVEHAETRLRLRWLAAQIARRCGRSWSALRRFSGVLSGLLILGRELDAARVFVELLALCHEQDWLDVLERPEIRHAIATLMASTELQPRALAVLSFALWTLREARPFTAEVLAHAGLYLVTSRDTPGLPFTPTRSDLLVFLDWDELPVECRVQICQAVGAAAPFAERHAHQLSREQQDLISWRYEVCTCARILFRTPSAGAAGATGSDRQGP